MARTTAKAKLQQLQTRKKGGKIKSGTDFERWIDGMEVVEASTKLSIIPNQKELDRGIQGHPTKCAWALAAARALGAPDAWVFTATAYIKHLDENGEMKVHRYKFPHKSAIWKAAWDKNKKSVKPVQIILNPPGPSQTLAGQLRLQREWLAAGGDNSRPAGRKHRKIAPRTAMELRNGHGQVVTSRSSHETRLSVKGA